MNAKEKVILSKELVTAPAPKLPHARKTIETELAPAKETPVDRFHKLQRTLGNRRVAELIRTKRLSTEGRIINLQPKLTVGAADDPHEREADRAAQHVLSIPDSALHGAESNHRTSEDQEAKKVARSIQLDASHPGHGSFEAGEEFESRLNASRGRGSALPDHVRSYMEPRFGADFSHVRVHTGNEAAELNRAVGARAFAHGSEIYYGSGYAPGHLELTAHELTHVIQQTGGARREDLTRKCEACSSGGGLCPQCEKEKDQVRRLPDIHSKPDRNIARSSFETAAPVTSIPAAAPAYTPATPSASDGRTLPAQPAGPDPALEATQRPDLGPFHPEIDHPAGIPASLSAGPPNIGRSPPQMSATLSFKMTMSSAGPPLMGTAFYRPITSRYVQRTDSNAYIAPSLECQVRQRKAPSIQRDSLNPLEWAASLLQSITADADRDQSQVQKQAGDRAAQLQSQGASQGNDLKSRSETGGLSLLDDAKTQGSQLSAQSTSQGQALETQGSTESAQLTGQSEASSQAIQQESSGATSKLQSDFGALDSRSRSAAGEAAGSVAADAGRLQMEGSTADMQVRNQWQALGSQASAGVQAAQNRTQSLVDTKNALVREYQGAGPHSPERFQSRWSEIQAQVAAAERGDDNFQHVENTGQNLNTQASGSWSRISSRAQSLAQHFTGMAGGAWSSLQSRWAALQSAAAAKLTRVRQLADAEVTRIRSLATAAWTRLQTLATQFASRLRNLAEQAWNGLKSRGATAWAALQAAATAAWTALQSQAQSIIATIESAIKTLIGKINGAVGRIMQFLASAVSSLLARVRSLTDRALSFVSSTAASAWGTLRDVGTLAWQGLKDVAERAGTSLKDLGVRVWESLRDIGARTWNNLKAIGIRLWNTLKNLAEHALNALGRAWEWIKRQASAAWDWLKRAWERVKQVALRAWDWIKRKAQAAWTWLKRKWEWLKAMLRRALAWLKAAWKWLKSEFDILQILNGWLRRLWAQLIAKLRGVLPVPSGTRELLNFFQKLIGEVRNSIAQPPAAVVAGLPWVRGQFKSPSEDYGTDNKGDAGGCGLCYKLPGPREAGTAAHRIIQLEFVGQLLAEGLRPETELVLGGVTPDLAFWRGDSRLEIGEIKPDNQENIEAGEKKLAKAIPAAKLKYPTKIVAPLGVPLVGGMVFPTLSPTPGCKTQNLHVKGPLNGLYLYYCEPSYKQLRQRGCQCNDGQKIPVGVKKEEKEKEKSRFQRFKEYLAERPALAFALTAALTVAVIALIALLLPIPEPVHKAIAAILEVSALAVSAAIIVGIFIRIPEKSEPDA